MKTRVQIQCTGQNEISMARNCMGLRLNSVIDHIILNHRNILLDGNQINLTPGTEKGTF